MSAKAVMALFASIVLVSGARARQHVEPLVLVEVNGVAVTGDDLDAMIRDVHRGGGLTASNSEGLVPRLLEKAIRDQLLLQDAYAMGMDQDDSVVRPVEQKATDRAISLYSQSQAELPEVTDADIRASFEEYYRRIKVRVVSLRTAAECEQAISRIRSGEITMGAFAVENSLDSWSSRGGLLRGEYWADVEMDLRDVLRGLEPGEFSEPIEFRGNWGFVRIDSAEPAAAGDYTKFEEKIRRSILEDQSKEAWARLVAEHERRVTVTERRTLWTRSGLTRKSSTGGNSNSVQTRRLSWRSTPSTLFPSASFVSRCRHSRWRWVRTHSKRFWRRRSNGSASAW